MNLDSFDIEICARTVYAEARGEGEPGMRAVAWAIINRFDAGKWYSGETIAECCAMHYKGSQYGQFSAWNVSDPNYALMFRLPDDDVTLAMCRGYVQSALMSVGDDPTEGATHYVNLKVCNPAWIAGATKTATIGAHTFYRNVK